MSASRGRHSTIRTSGSGHKGSHRSPGPAFFKASPRTSAVTLACGLILGAGLVVQPAYPQQTAFPQQTTTPQSQTREQASSVTAPTAAALSFNLAPAVFSYPQSRVYPASFPDNFSPARSGQPGQPGTALKGDLSGVVEYAYAGLGRPYVWGGTSFISGWDCSGFVQWAYRHAGIELPRVSQWEALRPTTTPSPGDLVTQRPDGPNHWAHVGIYVGNGMMISALNPDEGTVLHSVGPEGSSWFFTTSVGVDVDAPSGLVAGGPLMDYRAPATAPSPAEVPSEASSSNARQDSTTKDDGKRRIEAATLSRVKVPETGNTKNTSKISNTPEREKEADREKSAERENPAGKEETREREKPAGQDDTTKTEKPRPEETQPSDEESPKRDNTAGTDKPGKDKAGTDKTAGSDKTAESGEAAESDNATESDKAEESTGTKGPGEENSPDSSDTRDEVPATEPISGAGAHTDPAGSTEDSQTEGSVDGSAAESPDAAAETALPVEPGGTGEAGSEQTIAPEESETTVPEAPAADAGSLQATVAATALEQVGQPHDAVSFIEAVLTGSGYAPAPDGRDYLQLGTSVSVEEAAAGDLLYYTDASGQTVAAIYMGNGLAVGGGGKDGQAFEFSLADVIFIRLAG